MIGKVIQGYWDNQPIWREKTASEALVEELEKAEYIRNQVLEEELKIN